MVIPRRSIHAEAKSAPTTAPSPLPAQSSPNPKSPALNDTFASTTSETFISATISIARFQETSTAISARERAHDLDPLGHVPPVPAALDAPLLEHGAPGYGAAARRRSRSWPRSGRRRRRRRRPRRRSRPSSVPIVIVSCSASAAASSPAAGRRPATRFGSPAYAAGPGEPGGDAGDERERDDLPRADGEDEEDERAQADEVGADQQPLAREPVDERAEQQPDRDRRQEVGDQQRADPHARVRAVPDVDAERDHRDERPEAGDERRAEEEPEARGRAKHVPLA